MATIGQVLATPEAGWKRIDDTSASISYTGWSAAPTSASYYNSTLHKTTTTGSVAKFNFTGTKVRVIGTTIDSAASSIDIFIDNVKYSFAENTSTLDMVLVFELVGLANKAHSVRIVTKETKYAYLDAIDIDSTGDLIVYSELSFYELNPGRVKSSIDQLSIGDAISCEYITTTGAFGHFENLGAATKALIPAASSATPDGAFYFIHAGYDYKGRVKLIADRNIQYSISWDALNTAGIASELKNPRYNKWLSMDNNIGLNYDITKSADNPSPVVFNNELYTIWAESNGTINLIRLKKFDGTNWVSADNNVGLNYDIASQTITPSLTVYNNFLYCIWVEYTVDAYKVRVKRFDGTNWVSADDNTGLNYAPKMARTPSSTVFNNELYITWAESDGTVDQLRVKKFDGANWVSVDNNTSLNYDMSQSANTPVATVFNDALYITWYEKIGTAYQTRVKKFDGTNWISADNNVGLNYNTTVSAVGAAPIVFNNELYIFWSESSKIRVKKFDGTNWVSADNNTGLNYDTTKSAATVCLTVFNNELYVLFSEQNGTAYQVRARRLNGTIWESADNNSSLNYDTTKGVASITATPFNNELYIVWREASSTSTRIRVKKLTEVKINDTAYDTFISLLTGGTAATDKDNEWDSIVVGSTLDGTITAGDNNVWNWNNIASWTSTTPAGASANRAVRGGGTSNVNTYASVASTTANTTTGFRPVLLIEFLIKVKYLILDGTEYKSIDDGILTTRCTVSDDAATQEAAFTTYGMDNLSGWTDGLRSQLSSPAIKIAMYKK